MDKTPADTSSGTASNSTTTTAEARTLRDVVYSSKRSGGNYGSLAKSQVQPTYYVCHKAESDDTLQRLALKYSINIQEIKRINKIWSDAEITLRETVYIPVNTTQLATIRSAYPNIEVVQSLPTSGSTTAEAQTASTMPSSDSSTSIQSNTSNSSYQDYLSKIDQQIQSTKNSLQSLDIKDTFTPRPLNPNNNNSPQNNRSPRVGTERAKGAYQSSDNNVIVNIPNNNNSSRDKHVSAALKRIQQEQDEFDEL